MVLISHVWEEHDVFYNYYGDGLRLWEAFLFSLWSFSMFCKKFCEFFPTLTATLLTQSLKQVDSKPPKVLEVVYFLATNDFHIHEQARRLWLFTLWLHGCDYH